MTERPWEHLKEILSARDSESLKLFLNELSSAETARGISRLTSEEQRDLLILLDPGDAADVFAAALVRRK